MNTERSTSEKPNYTWMLYKIFEEYIESNEKGASTDQHMTIQAYKYQLRDIRNQMEKDYSLNPKVQYDFCKQHEYFVDMSDGNQLKKSATYYSENK